MLDTTCFLSGLCIHLHTVCTDHVSTVVKYKVFADHCTCYDKLDTWVSSLITILSILILMFDNGV